MSNDTDLTRQPDHEEFEILMMGYLDSELTAEQDLHFRKHLEACEHCPKELVHYRALAEIARSVRLREPQDYEMERFWLGIYNRMERRSGWTLLVISVLVLTVALVVEIARTNLLAWWVKIGVGALALGFVLLFLSVLRTRLRTLPYDRYREVQR